MHKSLPEITPMQSYKTPRLSGTDAEQKRREIRGYFNATCDLYEALFACLNDDKGFYQRPEPLRHPLIFYFGHTATFFVNKLISARLHDERVDERIESMMAIGVDEMSWDDLDNRNYDWPTVNEVRQYRNQVRELVNSKIDNLPLTLPIGWDDPFWIILMGIEHERIHLETSSVLLRQLDLEFLHPLEGWPICPQHGEAPINSLQPVAGGLVKQGRALPSADNPAQTYGWDNEYGELTTDVASFSASRFLVSNQEYLEFVDSGGYQESRWWSEEGWRWRQFRGADHPVFWVADPKAACGFRYRAVFEEIDMPFNWPVEVNYLEASAFCAWLSDQRDTTLRLPTEAEWYRLHEVCGLPNHSDWHEAPGNINLEYYASSSPVDAYMHHGFGDVVGNVWQWTETAINGFEGFRVHPVYDDFSVPTFDGKHNLIKGGSWISTGNESLLESRYAFRRHFYQHAGFRYVESEAEVEQQFNIYETDDLIAQYLEFHYGKSYFDVPNFPRACIDEIFRLLDNGYADIRKARALDIGCAVGRSSFELARRFDRVDAVDFSTRFIRNALHLREQGQIRYMIPVEGEISELKTFKLDELGIGERVNRVEFSQGDASNLKAKYTDYDLIFAGNLIDRLYDPAKFLMDIETRLRPGGLLVLTSPYTWLEEYTKKEKWLGGIRENGETVTTYDGIRRRLSDSFEEIGEPLDIPFVIRETARKHQHTVAQMTVWKKRIK